MDGGEGFQSSTGHGIGLFISTSVSFILVIVPVIGTKYHYSVVKFTRSNHYLRNDHIDHY